MTRKTLVEVASMKAAGEAIDFSLSAVKSGGDVAFKVAANTNSDTIWIADASGKERVFRDADDFFKQAGALSMLLNMMDVSFNGLSMLAPRPFTGDIIKKSQATVAAYTKQKTDADARIVKLNQEAALMAADPTVPQSRKDENVAQKTAVQSLSAFLAAEIARINAILAG